MLLMSDVTVCSVSLLYRVNIKTQKHDALI